MLKTKRQQAIIELCEQHDVVTVKFIQEQLKVSDMTIRRDLDELASQNLLIRVHGGAKSLNFEKKRPMELSHGEKKQLHSHEKEYIAQKAATAIQENDTIFLGPGTTIELMTKYLPDKHLRIITNSLPVFNLLASKERYDLYLIGGAYRKITGAFVGSIANETIQKLSIEKAFVGVNGITEEYVSTFSIEEGKFQQLVLDKAQQKFLVADANKFNHSDFYNFYNLKEVNALYTDHTISMSVKSHYEQYTNIIH
ncbi:DeoR family transcriptional regulator [Enterococcus saigonensis]|uniref:Lactose phosphotransferase system repressor n=1 Tax=Enterococcus saigonensis TaxID=1805431 RepID=A0A679ILI0_9ENTE|nr:DeoR/GlpR family DNA-binding transcription regulator [Enterococcus saigonensis]BCA85551.1 DeoR family transcriptional regulator [Enterococcus saigonensis]